MGIWFARLMMKTLREKWLMMVLCIPVYFAIYILVCIMLGLAP